MNWIVGRDRMRTPSSWPPLEQHLREPQIVGGGRNGARAAGIVARRSRHIDQLVGQAGRRIGRESLREAAAFVGRQREGRIVHAKRLEDALVEERGKAPPAPMMRASLRGGMAATRSGLQIVFPDNVRERAPQ